MVFLQSAHHINYDEIFSLYISTQLPAPRWPGRRIYLLENHIVRCLKEPCMPFATSTTKECDSPVQKYLVSSETVIPIVTRQHEKYCDGRVWQPTPEGSVLK